MEFKKKNTSIDPLIAAFDKIRDRSFLAGKGIELLLDLVQELKETTDELKKRIDYLENISQEKHLKH